LPIGPFFGKACIEPGDGYLGRRGIALGIVIDEQQLVLFQYRPGLQTRLRGNALGVRNLSASPIGAPLPMMERTDNGAAFHAAQTQVSTHVRTISINDGDPAILTLESHQLGAENIQGVGLAVLVVLGKTQAVPATGIAVRQRLCLDFCNEPTLVLGYGRHCYSPRNSTFFGSLSP